MKILYCITSSSWGGAQLHVLELCKDQIRRGNDVVFVVGNKGPLLDKVKNIRGVKLYLMPSLHREINPFFDIYALFQLRKIIKYEKPDIVHLHSSKAGILGRLATYKLGTKVIFTVHGWSFTEGINSKSKKMLFRIIEKVVAPLTTCFICVSEYDRKIGLKYGVLKKDYNIKVIHNGAPEAGKKVTKKDISKRPVKFIMTARFSPQKDQETLIRAFSHITKKDFQLLFVGAGPTLSENKQLVNKLNLEENISFVGFKANVIPYLLDSDVYILSTKYEGLPISIIEAMSCGLPIIATNVGGNSELVTNNGYLVRNEDELVKAIKLFVQHKDRINELGEKSYINFNNEFKLEKCLSSVNKVYNKLLLDKDRS